jgi:hypothetical protein
MNEHSDYKSHHVSEETLRGMAQLLADDAALTAFKSAALNNDLWQQAQANPRGYFASAGIDIPDVLNMSLQSHQTLKPWPPTIPELQMVTMRCWWVWGRVDEDEEPVKPFLFCLEAPAILLDYIRR